MQDVQLLDDDGLLLKTSAWFELYSDVERRTLRSMYRRGSRYILEAGLICGHAKVAVGKFNTDHTGGSVGEFVRSGSCKSEEGPLCIQVRGR